MANSIRGEKNCVAGKLQLNHLRKVQAIHKLLMKCIKEKNTIYACTVST